MLLNVPVPLFVKVFDRRVKRVRFSFQAFAFGDDQAAKLPGDQRHIMASSL
jgi:hypothetical protein